ncbi:hypothetical protein CLAFUW4_13991, partial [Fulvia fulva]
MVQIKSPDFNSATDGPKHYWKIDNHRHSIANLRGRKHIDQNMANIGISKFVSDKMTTDRKQSLLTRHDRGFLNYQKCTVSELRRFCKSRGLDPPSQARKYDLVDTLEQADDIATLDRFV